MSAWSMVEFTAMGSPCRIVAPDAQLARDGEQLVHELEARWSRFLPTSEINALNEHAGRVAIVSPETYELVSSAQLAREATSGAFNPLMLDQLCALGYDRTWEHVVDGGRGQHRPSPDPATDLPIELFAEISAVRLPAGARFDPGGIGKGLAGDMVTAALTAAGATSVQVELGGDVRVVGPAWNGGEWAVTVDDRDHGRHHAATIELPEGGVATSSRLRRRWINADGEVVHHLLDAATGAPAVTDLDAVTAVAPTLWWAEVVAKVALMAGAAGARRVFDQFDVTGVLVAADPTHAGDALLNSRSVA